MLLIDAGTGTLPVAEPLKFIGVAVYDHESGALIIQARRNGPGFSKLMTPVSETIVVGPWYQLAIPDGFLHRTLRIRMEFVQPGGEAFVIDDIVPPLSPAVDPTLAEEDEPPKPGTSILNSNQELFLAMTPLLIKDTGPKDAELYETLKHEALAATGGAP